MPHQTILAAWKAVLVLQHLLYDTNYTCINLIPVNSFLFYSILSDGLFFTLILFLYYFFFFAAQRMLHHCIFVLNPFLNHGGTRSIIVRRSVIPVFILLCIFFSKNLGCLSRPSSLPSDIQQVRVWRGDTDLYNGGEVWQVGYNRRSVSPSNIRACAGPMLSPQRKSM